MAPRIVAISGKSGCGNTSVCELLAKRLGVSPPINYTFRAMAKDRGISFEAMLKLANEDPAYSYDLELDKKQVELARAQARERDCVIGSRLAIWLLPDASLRLYLAGSLEVRAARIRDREGDDLAKQLAFTRERDASDHMRYLTIHGIDNDDLSAADLVINTELWMPPAIVDIVLAALKHQNPRQYRRPEVMR
jgi:CMP/dCMP kinase